MSKHPEHYIALSDLARKASHLRSVAALLGWDQETYMPAGGANARAEQVALMAGLQHEMLTDKKLGDLIESCAADTSLTSGDTPESANIREMRKDFNKRTKLPGELVSALAEATSRAQHAWKDAREKGDFGAFRIGCSDKMNTAHALSLPFAPRNCRFAKLVWPVIHGDLTMSPNDILFTP